MFLECSAVFRNPTSIHKKNIVRFLPSSVSSLKCSIVFSVNTEFAWYVVVYHLSSRILYKSVCESVVFVFLFTAISFSMFCSVILNSFFDLVSKNFEVLNVSYLTGMMKSLEVTTIRSQTKWFFCFLPLLNGSKSAVKCMIFLTCVLTVRFYPQCTSLIYLDSDLLIWGT